MNEITRILQQVEEGDGVAAQRLLPLIYDELRQLAAQQLAGEKPGQALALMDHPNIAKVLNAGATESGRPCVTPPKKADFPFTSRKSRTDERRHQNPL